MLGMVCSWPNTGVAIKLQAAERRQLETWQSAHGTPQQVALRCRIILGALAGAGQCVDRRRSWRKPADRATVAHAGREQGIGEVWQIAAGRGRKPQYDQAQRAAIIEATLQSKPKGMTHWSCRLMAEAQGSARARSTACGSCTISSRT